MEVGVGVSSKIEHCNTWSGGGACEGGRGGGGGEGGKIYDATM